MVFQTPILYDQEVMMMFEQGKLHSTEQDDILKDGGNTRGIVFGQG